MRAYFLRRLLLIPPTLLGLTLIVFFITRLAPGGPLEQALMQAQQTSLEHGAGRTAGQGMALSTDQIDQLKHYYGFDKPWYIAYVQWLGKVAQGDLGTSFRYNEPVWDLIRERFPISIFYGLTTLVITYTVCVPLGVLKAIKHRTWVDTGSSVLIFAGYAVPGYVLGALLLVIFSARLRWFPMSGFESEGFANLSFTDKIGDIVHHSILPLCCYLIGSFAFVTLLLKNQLMDTLASDYMRTVVAKGVPYRRAVLGHAFRNSIIPLATDFGQNLALFFTGSFLIEHIFDINGFGLLGYTSILDRDYPVVMGILLLSSLLLLLGNLVSDVLVALADPRIRFG